MKKKKRTPEEQAELDRLIVSANADLDRADAAAKAQGQSVARLHAIFDQLSAEARTRMASLIAIDGGFEAMVDTIGEAENHDVGLFAMVGLFSIRLPDMKPLPRLRRGK